MTTGAPEPGPGTPKATTVTTPPHPGTPCDHEPIHHPGAIQARGMLLAVDDAGMVTHTAGTDGRFLRRHQILGRPLSDALGGDLVESIGRIAATALPGGHPAGLDVELQAGFGPVDVRLLVHRNRQGTLILEFQPRASPAADPTVASRSDAAFDEAVRRIREAPSEPAILDAAAAALAVVTGFDRVMTYSFRPDGSGVVTAERRASELPTFLGRRFPATDIPAPARSLYLEKRLRVIADVDRAPLPITVADGHEDAPPLDLTLADLRAIAPAHIAYLKNLGVAASVVASLVVDRELTELFVCHHLGPVSVGFRQRSRIESLATITSAALAACRARARAARLARGQQQVTALLQQGLHAPPATGDINASPAESILRTVGHRLAEVLEAGGAAVIHAGRVTGSGHVPEDHEVLAIARTLRQRGAGGIEATSRLAEEHPRFEELASIASGVLLAPIPGAPEDAVLWFRPPTMASVSWAGDPRRPHAPAGAADGGLIPSPRRDFSDHVVVERRQAHPWAAGSETTAELAAGAIASILLAATSRERAAIARRTAAEAADSHAHDRVALHRREADADDVAEAAAVRHNTFIHRVSQGIRAPLIEVLTSSRRLADATVEESGRGSDDPVTGRRRREQALELTRKGDRIIRMLDDLRDLSLLDTGGIRPERSPVHPLRVIHDAISEFAIEARTRGVRLRAVVGSELPGSISSDPARVRQILGGLLRTAISRSPGGVVSIAVDRPTGTCHLRLRVSDDGGADAGGPQLFDPAEGSDHPDVDGLLGLAVPRGLARLLGGSLEAERTEAGITCTWLLPLSGGGEAPRPIDASIGTHGERRTIGGRDHGRTSGPTRRTAGVGTPPGAPVGHMPDRHRRPSPPRG